MLDITLVDITPNFCPDCGNPIDLPISDAWLDFRKHSVPYVCPCSMTIFYVKDLETVIRRITDDRKNRTSTR